MRGAIAAGHPVTAEAGADVLRDGGNAVDAAVAAMLTSFAAEPLLTGLGAGGYMLVAPPGAEPVLLDFIVAAPGRGAAPGDVATLTAVEVSFGDVIQLFHVGPASCGVWGTPAGICYALRRFGSRPLAELAAPAIRHARAGVEVTLAQAYVFEILAPIVASSPEARERFMPLGRPPRTGERLPLPELADGMERLAAEGPEPFYRGDIGQAVLAWLERSGGAVTYEDLADYAVEEREPLGVAFRGRSILTNPPPSAGGVLLAYSLALLERDSAPPGATGLVAAMAAAQAERTPDFVYGLPEPGFAGRFLSSRLGSTTHISVLDAGGLACSVTCTNGEGSAVAVPGTGMHVNNLMGEADLSPLGFLTHPPGRRLPSMMAPTVALGDGEPELVLGSAGSNRIRSALLQVLVAGLDGGMPIDLAVAAPRLHFEAGTVYAEPGVDCSELEALGHAVARFASPNLFFGGVQAVAREPGSGRLRGGADFRRGGAAVVVE